MRSRILGLLLPFLLPAVLPSVALAEVLSELRTTQLASLFGAPATIANPKISPDGSRMLFLQQDESGVSILRLWDFASDDITSVLAGSDAGYDIYWCAFANSTRVLCDLRQERSASCASPAACWAYQIYVAIDSDGSNLLQLPVGTGCPDIDRARDTHHIDWLPEDPNHVLFSCLRETTLVGLYDGTEMHVDGVAEAARVYSDGRGFLKMYRDRREQTERWFVRDSIDSGWRLFEETNLADFSDPFRPAGYGSDTDSLLHIAWNPATETWGLFARALGDESRDSLVFAHPDLDIELVDTVGPYERAVSVPYFDGRSQRYVFDERLAEVLEFAAGLLPGVHLEILDESWDQIIYLARARIGNRTGEFVLIDMANETIRSIAPEYVHLGDYEVAETRLVQIAGADGGRISGLLTLPPEASVPVPAVVIPRGEAAHETIADPFYLAEFLAASGYAVLRVNLRGPEDLGGWIPSRSVVGWRRTSSDIRAAADYLVEAGFAEADRICAAGTDYGAYAALLAAIETPDLFRCLVSISGIADPRSGAGAAMLVYGGASIPAQIRGEFSTVVSAVNRDLRDASPIRRADELEAPVLLFQGHRDYHLDRDVHAAALARALERADKSVAFYEYRYEYHSIRRGPYRTDMLARVADFLAAHTRSEQDSAIDVGP